MRPISQFGIQSTTSGVKFSGGFQPVRPGRLTMEIDQSPENVGQSFLNAEPSVFARGGKTLVRALGFALAGFGLNELYKQVGGPRLNAEVWGKSLKGAEPAVVQEYRNMLARKSGALLSHFDNALAGQPSLLSRLERSLLYGNAVGGALAYAAAAVLGLWGGVTLIRGCLAAGSPKKQIVKN